ncbi:hypothetical protein ACTXT7_014215 [Hymenolepis weldensis]
MYGISGDRVAICASLSLTSSEYVDSLLIDGAVYEVTGHQIAVHRSTPNDKPLWLSLAEDIGRIQVSYQEDSIMHPLTR